MRTLRLVAALRYSMRSLALASAVVCHCMFVGASAPPIQRHDVIDDVAWARARGLAGCWVWLLAADFETSPEGDPIMT